MATWDPSSALKGTPTGPGEPTPLYDPGTKKFIGWQYPNGAATPQPSSQGNAPDWYPGNTTTAAAQGASQTAQTPAQGAESQTANPAQSYLSPQAGQTGSGNMTWNDITSYGYQPSDIAAFQAQGWSPDQVMNSIQTGVASAPSKPTPTQDAFGITASDSGKGYATLKNNQGQTINVDNAGNYFTTDASGNNTPVSDIDAQKMGFQSINPETQALKQMGQVDPNTEALRQQLSGSYLDPSKAANPTAADYQKYLDTFKGVDPAEYAARAGLGTSMDSYLKSVQDEYNLGSQLDPVTQMQVEQQARKSQANRGNLYGSGQAAVEAMSTGQAGQALKQQRLGNLQTALGGEQSYLGSGLGMGSTAMQLYQQGLQNKANAQQGTLSYLGSGSTPYQAGAAYLNNAQASAANAAQGGPQYNPSALGAGTLGTSQQAPQYGLDVGAQAQSYYNSLNNFAGGGGATKNRGAAAGMGAASGALSGAVGGATLGSAIPGIGTAIGAVGGGIAGGLLGGASGYYS